MKPRITRWIFLVALFLVVACGPQVLNPKGGLQTVPEVGVDELEKVYTPKRMALLIGINAFDDPQWRSLNYAVNDADDFGSFLKDPSKGGFDQVIKLTTPQETTRNSIYRAIEHISKLNSNPLDTVLIYFSTHGTLEREAGEDLKQYLVASDTRFDDIRNSAMDLAHIQRLFKRLRSRRKVMILATCHSGSGKSTLDPNMREELSMTKAGFFVKPLDIVSEASVILSACAWGETAREDRKLGHDIYTYFFMEALGARGLNPLSYDPNADGATTVSEAHDYAREKTYYYTRGKQRPTAQSDIMGSDPIVLAGSVKRTGKPALFSYSESMDGIEVHVDGIPKGRLPGSVIIEPGVRTIEFIKADGNKVFFRKKVRFVMGKRVDAAELIEMANIDQTLGMGVSYRAFFSDDLNESVYAPMLTYGLNYGRNGPWQNTRWDMNLYAGKVSRTLEIEGLDRDGEFTRADLYGALLYEYKRGNLKLAGGPELGWVYLERRMPAEFENRTQSGVTGLMGSTANLEYVPVARWIFGFGGGINATYLAVDSDSRVEFGYAATMYVKFRM